MWIRVFSSISWKSLFCHWERWWRSRQSGQLAHRIRHEFVFTLHSVDISRESLEPWYTSVFHPCSRTKTLDSCTNSMDILPYNIISHLKKRCSKEHTALHDSAEISISLDTLLEVKWNCYVLNARPWPWAAVLSPERWVPDADGTITVSRESNALPLGNLPISVPAGMRKVISSLIL